MKSHPSPNSGLTTGAHLTTASWLLLAAVLCLPLGASGAGVAYFSRATDTIQVSGQTVLGTTATFEAVVWLPANGTGAGSVFNEWTDNLEDKRLYVGTNFLQGYGLLSRGSVETNVSISTGTWHHIAYVFDGAQQRLYLDGVLLTNVSASGSFDNASGLGFVGASPQGGLNPSFIGFLDSLRVSGVARYTTASFTPPAGDMTTDADTLLLYNFNEPPGSLTVADLSGNGRTGTLGTGVPGATAPAFTTVPPEGSRGTALFSRTTDTIQASGQTVLGTTATFEAVIMLPAHGTSAGSVFNEWTDNLEDKRLYVGTNFLHAYGLLSRGAVETNVTISVGTWHHIAYVFDGSQQRLYLDGMLLTNVSASGSFDNAPGLGFVGASPQGGLNPSFIGYLDSLRISSVARYTTASFTPPAGDMTTDADTLLLYNFNEPPGSLTVADLSGNGRTGTLGVGVPGATSPTLSSGDLTTANLTYNPANGHYYQYVTNAVSWAQAKTNAEARVIGAGWRGHLVTIQDAAENEFVRLLSPTVGAWLGGFQPAGSAEPSGGWQWVTGEPFTYTNWKSGEPNNQGVANEEAVNMLGTIHGVGSPGKWNDANGSNNTAGFIVEYEPPTDIVFNPANGHYYQYVSNSVTWAQAKADAQSRIWAGGWTAHLATIQDAAENEFVRLLSPTVGAWLGGFQPAGSTEPAGGWQWVTGEPFTYTNWKSGEPNNQGVMNEESLSMLGTIHGIGSPGGWNDANGSNNTGGYVIEYEPPSGVIFNPANGHYYRYVSNLVTWSEAKTNSDARVLAGGWHGHLVTIQDSAENEFVRLLSPTTGTWLGGFQPAGSTEPAGGWQWVTAEPFSYTNWKLGEPNNQGAVNEESLSMLGTVHGGGSPGFWNDGNGSNNTGGFIVEYERIAPVIVNSPINQTVSSSGIVVFTVSVSGAYPVSFQWQLSGTNIPGATNATLTLQSPPAGSYRVIVSNSGGSVTSAPATLSLLDLQMYSGLTISGTVGAMYRIDYVDTVGNTNNWQALTTFALPSSPYLYFDAQSGTLPKRYYRAVLLSP